MFERTFVENGEVSRRAWAIAVSLLTQCLFVCLGALIPLLYTNALPTPGMGKSVAGRASTSARRITPRAGTCPATERAHARAVQYPKPAPADKDSGKSVSDHRGI